MLENQSKTEKTRITTYFLLKTYINKFDLAVWAQGQITWDKMA